VIGHSVDTFEWILAGDRTITSVIVGYYQCRFGAVGEERDHT